MNLFFLDRDPVVCARQHHDKHVVKMILECAQMLSTAHHVVDDDHRDIWYKPTHVKHPTTLWVMSSLKAYQYTYDLFNALSDEYTYRYGKVHKTWATLGEFLRVPPTKIPDTEWIDPPQAMPEQYKGDDAISAYRRYYLNEKVQLSKWTKREEPQWLYEYILR